MTQAIEDYLCKVCRQPLRTCGGRHAKIDDLKKTKCPRRKFWYATHPTFCTSGACPDSKNCSYPEDYGRNYKR